MNIEELTLYPDPFYSYATVLEGVSYNLEFKYNTRIDRWVINLYDSDFNPLVLGKKLLPSIPILFRYVKELTGYFLLVPIGEEQNFTNLKGREVWKYYKLVYVWE